LSADFAPGPHYSITRICMLSSIIWTLLRTSARWTIIHPPDARTSHLRTLSKIVETGLSALFRARHRSARASRTLYSSFRERQHLSANFLLPPAASFASFFRSVRLTGPRILQHVSDSSTLIETAVFRAPDNLTNRSAGRASYSNVSDRQHLSKPPLPRVPADRCFRSAGPRIMHT